MPDIIITLMHDWRRVAESMHFDLQITSSDEFAPLCTFLEVILTMMW